MLIPNTLKTKILDWLKTNCIDVATDPTTAGGEVVFSTRFSLNGETFKVVVSFERADEIVIKIQKRTDASKV